jgi:hypothetical protein
MYDYQLTSNQPYNENYKNKKYTKAKHTKVGKSVNSWTDRKATKRKNKILT